MRSVRRTTGPAIWGALVAISLFCVAATAAETADDQGRLEILCAEQPARLVSFGEPGEVSYGETSPSSEGEVQVIVTKAHKTGDSAISGATITSSMLELATDQATWIPGRQVDAHQGRLRIDLDNLIMTLTEYLPDGGARFRRFECRLSPGDAGASTRG